MGNTPATLIRSLMDDLKQSSNLAFIKEVYTRQTTTTTTTTKATLLTRNRADCMKASSMEAKRDINR